MPLAPNGFGPKVAILNPNNDLVLFGDTRLDAESAPPATNAGGYFAVVWGWHLMPIDKQTTRLVERWLGDWNESLFNFVFMRLFLEPGAFIMERKNLLGIKERAEKSV